MKKIIVVDDQLDAATMARLIGEFGGEAEVEIKTEGDLDEMRGAGTILDVGDHMDLHDHFSMVERVQPEGAGPQVAAGRGRRFRAQWVAGEAQAQVLVETRQQRRAAARAARKGGRP